MSCVVPGCKSGYGTKNVFPPGVTKHRFPKDLELRKRWRDAIPRADWEPTDHSRICSLHFDDSDYNSQHQDSNKHRKNDPDLKVRRLKEDAIPRYFPGCPSYLSSKPPQQRSEAATSSNRFSKISQQLEAKSQSFLDSDVVTDFASLMKNLPTEFPSSWGAITLKRDDELVIEEVAFSEDGKPHFRYSLKVDASLSFRMTSNDITVSPSKIRHINSSGLIERHSDVSNILAFLNSSSDKNPKCDDAIEDCITKLSKVSASAHADDPLRRKLDFVIEQLSLIATPKTSRRYSAKLQWKSLTWMKTGPALYKQLLSDGLMTLPSLTRLQRLSSAYRLETGKSIFVAL